MLSKTPRHVLITPVVFLKDNTQSSWTSLSDLFLLSQNQRMILALGSSLSPVGQSFNHDNLPMTPGVWVPSAAVILSLFARTGLKNGGLVQTFNWNRVSAKREKSIFLKKCSK